MTKRQQGNNRPPQQQQQVQQNERKLSEKTAPEVFREIMQGVDQMQRQIQQALPTHISYGLFRSTLMMAMRHTPDIMHCSTGSIVTGAMKAAIDGVLLDGKEAALVPSNNKVKDFQTGREFYRKDARYNLMIAGLRKSIMRGGKIRDFQSVVVYANEKFSYERGLNPSLVHVPILDGQARGLPVGAYSIAWFADGGAPSFEVMNKAEIYIIRDLAQSGPVWKGPVETEMWRKTVSRRHRKSLPGQEVLVDMEAVDDFPTMGGAQFDIAAGNTGILPDKVQGADAPKRGDYIAIEQQLDGSNGVPLDFGNSGEMSAEQVELEEREQRGDAAPQQAKQVVTDPKPAEEKKAKPAAPRTIGPVPEGFETWEAWGDLISTKMKTAATLPKLEDVVKDAEAMFQLAPDDEQSRLTELYEIKAEDHRQAAR